MVINIMATTGGWRLDDGRARLTACHSSPPPIPGTGFPAEIVNHAVRLYHVFSLNLRDVELIPAERGIVVTHESVRH